MTFNFVLRLEHAHGTFDVFVKTGGDNSAYLGQLRLRREEVQPFIQAITATGSHHVTVEKRQ